MAVLLLLLSILVAQCRYIHIDRIAQGRSKDTAYRRCYIASNLAWYWDVEASFINLMGFSRLLFPVWKLPNWEKTRKVLWVKKGTHTPCTCSLGREVQEEHVWWETSNFFKLKIFETFLLKLKMFVSTVPNVYYDYNCKAGSRSEIL